MTIRKEQKDNQLTVYLEGKLDTVTAPDLETEMKSSLEGVKELVFELKDLSYISSAGLRVLLSCQKVMNRQGTMVIRGASADLVEIFDVTGFSDIFTIEE